MSSPQSESPGGRHRDMVVIREICSGIDAQTVFESELDRALEAGCDVIVVEPERLGEDTLRWIGLGDCLHKTAIYTSSGSILAALLWEDKPYIYCPLTGLGLVCIAVYHMSWKHDPCSQYRPAEEGEVPESRNVSPSTPIVLVKRAKRQDRRGFFNSAITVVAMTVSVWKVYRWIKFVAA